MSLFSRFQITDESQKARGIKKLVTGSTPDFDFFLLMTLSVIMATLGLALNSVAVVIGSMLIAPMLYPILSLSLGLVMSDYQLFYRSLYTIGKATLIALGLSCITALFLVGETELTSEILARTDASIAYFVIALVSGLAASYSLVQPDLNEAFPGIAISVALLPPLAVTGIGIAHFDWGIISGSLGLFVVNVLGIIFASMISFSMMNLYTKKKIAASEIKKEEQRIEEQHKAIEELDEMQRNGEGETHV